MGFPPQPQFEVVHDVRSTTWVDERLMRRDHGSPGWVVGEIVPSGFDAYARVFHRVHEVVRSTKTETEWVTVRWAEIAERRGKVAHQLMQIESLIDHPDAFDDEHWKSISWGGELFPPTSGWRTWNAWFWPTSLASTRAPTRRLGSGSGTGTATWGRRSETSPEPMIGPSSTIRLPGTSPPEVAQLAFRQYLVFRGPLAGLSRWFGWREESPNYWYPDDRAWIVMTEIDGFSTFVGGSRSCVDTVMSSPNSRAWPVRSTIASTSDQTRSTATLGSRGRDRQPADGASVEVSRVQSRDETANDGAGRVARRGARARRL